MNTWSDVGYQRGNVTFMMTLCLEPSKYWNEKMLMFVVLTVELNFFELLLS